MHEKLSSICKYFPGIVSSILDKFILRLKPELSLSFKISFGIFLFILFFQPFPIDITDINRQVLIVSGFGIIMLALIVSIRLLTSWLVEINKRRSEKAIFPTYINGVAIFILNVIAFGFYAHFAAGVKITLLSASKIVFICLIPPFIIGVHDLFQELKNSNEILLTEKKNIQKQIEKYEEHLYDKTIEFVSENSHENFSITANEIAYFKSADNYVEIVYIEADVFKKRLIRSTLKNIELQVKQFSNFVRCHRTCIVNIHFIRELQNSSGNLSVAIKGFNEILPVSRQYLNKLRESI